MRAYPNLTKYVEDRNAFAKLFKDAPLSINSPKDRKTIRQLIECDLSPENLCCDGELPAAQVRVKARFLNAALNELNIRDQV